MLDPEDSSHYLMCYFYKTSRDPKIWKLIIVPKDWLKKGNPSLDPDLKTPENPTFRSRLMSLTRLLTVAPERGGAMVDFG